jgi:hypothetical protein
LDVVCGCGEKLNKSTKHPHHPHTANVTEREALTKKKGNHALLKRGKLSISAQKMGEKNVATKRIGPYEPRYYYPLPWYEP